MVLAFVELPGERCLPWMILHIPLLAARVGAVLR